MHRKLQTGLAIVGLIGLGGVAGAQTTGGDEYVKAKLIAKDTDSRSITVRLEGDNAARTFKVSDDARLVKNLDNLRRPIRIDDLNVGNDLQLELSTISAD